MILDTEDERAFAVYREKLRLARSFRPSCQARSGSRARVLITGFGRFGGHHQNASGLMVGRWLEALAGPAVSLAGPGAAPDAAPAIAQGVVDLEGVLAVEVAAMVLPVVWDLAAVLVLRMCEAFDPELVVMNGIAGRDQPLWLELGSFNAGKGARDASALLAPREHHGPIVSGAPDALPHLASWTTLAEATRRALGKEPAFGPSCRVELAGFPRTSNTFVCNATSYALGYGLDHPDEPFTLMEASHPRGADHGVSMTLARDRRAVPRWFVHWPSEMSGAQIEAGARVMKAMVAAQLTTEEPPRRGEPAMAEALLGELGALKSV